MQNYVIIAVINVFQQLIGISSHNTVQCTASSMVENQLCTLLCKSFRHPVPFEVFWICRGQIQVSFNKTAAFQFRKFYTCTKIKISKLISVMVGITKVFYNRRASRLHAARIMFANLDAKIGPSLFHQYLQLRNVLWALLLNNGVNSAPQLLNGIQIRRLRWMIQDVPSLSLQPSLNAARFVDGCIILLEHPPGRQLGAVLIGDYLT